jgi:hypothetical protein
LIDRLSHAGSGAESLEEGMATPTPSSRTSHVGRGSIIGAPVITVAEVTLGNRLTTGLLGFHVRQFDAVVHRPHRRMLADACSGSSRPISRPFQRCSDPPDPYRWTIRAGSSRPGPTRRSTWPVAIWDWGVGVFRLDHIAFGAGQFRFPAQHVAFRGRADLQRACNRRNDSSARLNDSAATRASA